MKHQYLSALLLVFAFFAGLPVRAHDALRAARDNELVLGPFSATEIIEGVPLTLRASVFLTLEAVDDELQIGARVVGDLEDLQGKVSALVDRLPLPTDNCARMGLENPNYVLRIRDERLEIEDDLAILSFGGDLDIWTCIKAPPCTKLDNWRIVFFDCNPPIKNRIRQPFEASVPFRLTVVNPQTVSLVPERPTVDLKGALADVVGHLLRIGGIDLSTELHRLLQRAVNPDLLTGSVPDRLLELDPEFSSARFFNNSGALAAEIEMRVSLDRETLLGGFVRAHPDFDRRALDARRPGQAAPVRASEHRGRLSTR